MRSVNLIQGDVTVLDRSDVDTDQIIPKQFLKRIERTGFGEFLFYDWFRSGEIELEPPGLGDCDNSGPGSSDCPEIHLAPAVVDLPMNGGVNTAFSTAIPAGSYHEVELKVDAVESDDVGAAAFFAAYPTFPRGKSVRVEGTFNGQPFVFTSSVEAEVELEFEPPLNVDQGGMNVTVNVDVSSWFRANGLLIDPSSAEAQSQISSNISASFEVYHDDDRDEHRTGSRHAPADPVGPIDVAPLQQGFAKLG